MLAIAERWQTLRRPRRARLERFGAIVELERPRALVFVDRDYARGLGLTPRPGETTWCDPPASATCDPATPSGALGELPLSAPLEAHLQLTDRCTAGCRGCYVGATPAGDPEAWGLSRWRRAVDHLADLGVFHLALGGGESATLPWLGELAAAARRRGLVPNLTTSGLDGVDELLAIADRFGQINVSLDGLGATYAAVRGVDGFAAADRAIQRLRRRQREIGINLVVTRHNFDQIDRIFAYARRRRLNGVEILRFKPAGRGARSYRALACTADQHRALLPAILRAARRHRMRARVDCSYLPMIACHRPDPRLLDRFAVYGCAGGDHLVAATPAGLATACSFAPPPDSAPQIDALGDYWRGADAFPEFRAWQRPAAACRGCAYHPLCRGGCRAVAGYLLGDPGQPDPECPRVRAGGN